MADVEPHVARPREAHDRVQVGAVVVEGPPRPVHERSDLGDVLVEYAERVGVRQHQAGDLVGEVGAQVVEVYPAALVRGDLHRLVARHRHGGRVRPVRGVGREDLRALLAAVLVVGAREQQPGQLAVRPGRWLKADVLEPGELRKRALEAPHQLQRPLGAGRILGGVKPGMAGERRDPLVQPRVVLHRARPERVGARVQVEVPARQAVVVAHDLGLGDLGQCGGLRAQEPLRDEVGEGARGDVEGRERGGAAARDRALVDRHHQLALLRGRGIGVGGGRRGGQAGHVFDLRCRLTLHLLGGKRHPLP